MILRQIFATFLLCAIAAAADVPLIRHNDTVERPKIPETGTFSWIESPGLDNAAETPRGALAARLAVSGRLFHWLPSPMPGRITGAADLADAALSPDESVLVIAERVGGQAPNSARIILFNLCNNRIVNGFTLDEVKPAAIRFYPQDARLLLTQTAQPELGRKAQLLTVDLAAGKAVPASPPFDREVLSAVTDGRYIWYTLAGDSYFYQLPADRPDATPLAMRTLGIPPRLLLSPDNSSLTLYAPGRIEFYDIRGDKPLLTGSLSPDAAFRPDWGTVISNDGRTLVLTQEDGPGLLIGGGAIRPIAEKSGTAGCYLANEKKFMLAVDFKDAINLYAFPHETRPETSVSPGKLKPFNRNEVYRLFARSGGTLPEAVLIDHRGNVSLLQIKPRRWQKLPVYEVAR